jgi:YidC/Oxa1 family membrane protein insertase
METKTTLAIVLSIVVFIGYYMVVSVVFPPKPEPSTTTTTTAPEPKNHHSTTPQQPSSTTPAPISTPQPTRVNLPADKEQFFTLETNLIKAQFTNAGGNIVSFKLKEHQDGNDLVDMALRGNTEAQFCALSFGDKSAAIDTSIYSMTRPSPQIIQFDAEYQQNGKNWTLTKKYTFAPDEYMFRLDVTTTEAMPLSARANADKWAYTLSFGPQIGPRFQALDERQDYRHYAVDINGKIKDQKVNEDTDATIDDKVLWAAILGKYFTLVAVPDATPYRYVFTTQPPEPGLIAASRLYIERPAQPNHPIHDVYHFYLGPKTSTALDIYDTNKSAFDNFSDRHLSDVSNTSGFWAILNPLEWLLKELMQLFYFVIPNYGVAIILVTVLVKLLLFPLTKKQSESTLRMQTMAPKIKEVQAKYKDNPQKMNAEMQALYKKEHYNPMSGCLPMLIQIPIFFAMYNLFNTHFDLRGAVFIPGWIPDLSQPEWIYKLPFTIPILGWTEIRLLPFIYVASQLLYGKIATPQDTGAGGMQMKMMLYVMPIVFFFILYNVPSGLLVYWIMTNILTMGQQLAINKHLAKKKALLQAESALIKKVSLPPAKRKRR